MSQPNLASMRTVADRMDRLGLDYAFAGGPKEGQLRSSCRVTALPFLDLQAYQAVFSGPRLLQGRISGGIAGGRVHGRQLNDINTNVKRPAPRVSALGAAEVGGVLHSFLNTLLSIPVEILA